MKYITDAVDRLSQKEGTRSDEDMSIIENIIHKTSDPKIAAVLALDLLLVGVDTVSRHLLSKQPDKRDLLTTCQ
jgi:cytochrome P450 family 49 subfamily A